MANKQIKRKKLHVIGILIPAVVVVLTAAFFIYTGVYYKAAPDALSALSGDDTVVVSETVDGWLFDGPSDDVLLIFYGGGKVEEEAYAPLMREIAEGGVDTYLVKMPFHLAVLDSGKADKVIASTSYDRYIVGGHSLGGSMAAYFAANEPNKVDGVVLCAAYATEKLDGRLKVVSAYGTQDGVLDFKNYEDNKPNLPAGFTELVIDGGNHSGFGCYGFQKGDGEAQIEQSAQRALTVSAVTEAFKE